MSEHGMVDTILLTEKCLLMLPFFDIVYLHTTVTLGSQKKTTLVVEIQAKTISSPVVRTTPFAYGMPVARMLMEYSTYMELT